MKKLGPKSGGGNIDFDTPVSGFTTSKNVVDMTPGGLAKKASEFTAR